MKTRFSTLIRKTRLRSGSTLKRTVWMRRGTGLKRVSGLPKFSKKRRREMKAYSLLREAFLLARPVCELCEMASSTDVHHRKGRGAHYLNPEHFVAACRSCHEYLHSHPSEARAKGWLI